MRSARHSRTIATIFTSLEAIELSLSLLLSRAGFRSLERRRPAQRPVDALRGNRPSWLDFKLGLRMLVKYPGLTVVAGLSIAFATAIGAGVFEFTMDLMYPKMPFAQGDRIVELRYRDLRTTDFEPRALHDFEVWRSELRTVEEIGAFQIFQRNLRSDRMGSRPVMGVEITAAAFGVPRVPPLLGRPLTRADELPGAPNVMVIGFDVWRSHFGADPDVIDETVRLASEVVRVVGVMPEGFAWPWNEDVWTPFRESTLDHAWGGGPGIQIVGRLAPGASRAEANAEIVAVTAGIVADHPESRERLRPEVTPWGALPFVAHRR